MAVQTELLQRLISPKRPLIKLPPVMSFFTGAGFLDLGMLQAGFHIIWSLEKDLKICEAHDYGMESYYTREKIEGTPPVIHSQDDIQTLGPNIIRRRALGTLLKGDSFGIIGGPPCPDFSIGGKNLGQEAERGRLTRVFVERLCELEPAYFLIENVKGLLRTRKHRSFLHNEIWKLEEKGYAIDLTILNTLNLGVPQDRERLFIIGVKRSLIKRIYSRIIKKGERNWFPWPVDSRYQDAKTRYDWPTITPFGATPPHPVNIPDELMVNRLLFNQEEIEQLPNGKEGFEPHSNKFWLISEGDVSRKSFKRLHRYRYSPTAAYGNNEVHLHPALPRRLLVREAMRIQSVPDSFALQPEMPLSVKFKIIGNGVPVKLAYQVSLALADFLTCNTDKI